MNKDVKEAVENVEKVVKSFRGTYNEHAILQGAIELIKKELEPKAEEENQSR